MSNSTSTLELVAKSEGIVAARENVKGLANASASAERAAQQLAKAVEESARQQAAAVSRMAAAAEAAEKRRGEAAEISARRRMEADARVEQRAQENQAKALARVQRQLMTEEQLIRQSENERRRIIIENTTITEAKRAELLRLSAARTQSQLAGMNAKETAGYGIGVMGAVVGGLAIGGAIGVAHSMMEVTREFDKLNASLKTVTGSEREAAQAFEALQSFAMTTPYTLREVVGAFVQLRNLGLNATGRELKAFGDMAAAFGDTLDHMLLAVGDAAMGINRPLKQFGVMAEASKNTSKKLSEDGKTTAFTFRGVTTEVEASAIAIENYLVKLSENNFAGAMANRMETLDGALSNLKDSWDKFVLSITQSGIEAALAKTVTQMSDFVNKVSEIIKNSKGATANTGLDTQDIMFGGRRSGTVGGIVRRFFPRQAMIESSPEGTGSTKDDQKSSLSALDKYLADANKLREQKYLEEYRQLVKNLKTKRELIEDEYKKEKEIITSGVSGNAALDAEQLAKAKKKHDDAIKALDKKERGKPKEFFLRSANQDMEEVFLEKMRKQEEAELDSVRQSLAKQEDTERASYEKRKKFLQDYLGPDQQELMARNEELWGKHLDALAEKEVKAQREKRKKHDSVLGDAFGLAERDPAAALQSEQAEKMQALQDAHDDELISTQEFEQAKFAIQQRYAEKNLEMQLNLAEQSTRNTEAMFGNLATVAKNLGGEQSGAYKAMFAMQKAFAIASAGISMETGIAKALELGWPQGIPAAMGAAAEGAKILAMITSTNYSGAYDKGGDIPAGRVGLVGEYGPEFVRGPATVTSRADTARALQGGSGMAGASDGGGGGGLNIINAYDAGDAVHAYMSSTRGQQTIVNHLKSNWRTIRAVSGGR